MIDRIPESVNENWDESEKKVQEILSENLKLSGMEFERVHRTGKSTSERARPIVARVFRYKAKVRVMEKAKHFKGTNVYINEDCSPKTQRTQPAMKAAGERGEIVFLRYDKLIVHPASQHPNKGVGSKEGHAN